MNIRLTIMKVLEDGITAYIPCEDRSKQESIRSMSYQIAKKKFNPAELDFIGITKATVNDRLYVKIYKRDFDVVYKMNDKGELVPFTFTEKDQELDHILESMRRDKVPQDQINTFIEDWNKPESESQNISPTT